MSLSLIFISLASTLPYSRSRTYLSYNATGGGEGGVRESLITVLYKTIARFKNGLGVGLRRARQLTKIAKMNESTCQINQNRQFNSPKK